MHSPGAIHPQEVVHKIAGGKHRLRAHARATGHEIIILDLGDETPESGDEASAVEGLCQFPSHHPPMPQGETPKTRVRQRTRQITDIHGTQSVSLTREGEHGVGPRIDSTLDAPGEMNAQEGEAWLRQRIDEVLDQVLPIWAETLVFAPEREDASR